jgi:hypothetical protein
LPFREVYRSHLIFIFKKIGTPQKWRRVMFAQMLFILTKSANSNVGFAWRSLEFNWIVGQNVQATFLEFSFWF